MKAAFLAVAVLATASVAFYFSAFSSSATAHASKTREGAGSPPRKSLLSRNPLRRRFLAADVFRSEPGSDRRSG